ncbi:MAG: hypothetical protein FRX49_00591 [Trebouxia sp. A1-2]|nr:MAG: hypothetical protein FRX49_00591 [Trebouxia sp. A1-2]
MPSLGDKLRGQACLHDEGFAEALEGVVLGAMFHQEHLPKSSCAKHRYLLQLLQLNGLHTRPFLAKGKHNN